MKRKSAKGKKIPKAQIEGIKVKHYTSNQ